MGPQCLCDSLAFCLMDTDQYCRELKCLACRPGLAGWGGVRVD